MFKSFAVVLALLLACPTFGPLQAEAASKSAANSKSSPGTTKASPGKTKAQAAKKKAPPGKGRNGYTAEERQKWMERAREVCRQKHGASSQVYDVDFRNLTVRCLPPGA